MLNSYREDIKLRESFSFFLVKLEAGNVLKEFIEEIEKRALTQSKPYNIKVCREFFLSKIHTRASLANKFLNYWNDHSAFNNHLASFSDFLKDSSKYANIEGLFQSDDYVTAKPKYDSIKKFAEDRIETLGDAIFWIEVMAHPKLFHWKEIPYRGGFRFMDSSPRSYWVAGYFQDQALDAINVLIDKKLPILEKYSAQP
ncbi:hypothetical protein KBD61_01995 [Patescibacteria group bacterium]|nr:hypothetical protein [Patescibacteria group bacterium]MBP9709782.1 hypothetical protein [Patescibacteria group bacterium]